MDTIQTGFKSLTEFKREWRGVCSDTWGDAMEAWFEATGQMNKRGLEIPADWNYRPGLGSNGTDTESYWYELFEASTDELIQDIAHLMCRYCQFLKYKGKSY